MQVMNVEASKVFPRTPGKLQIPVGKFDMDDPKDIALKSLVPEIDSFYKFPGDYAVPLLLVASRRQYALLTGTTGIGKTKIVEQLAAKLELPYTRVNFDEDISRAELVGFFGLPNPAKPEDDGYKWGALAIAIQHPGILFLDEWDAIRPGIGLLMQRLLEDKGSGIFVPERNEVVPKHKDCIILAASNTSGMGDQSGLYHGTNMQSFAQINRFHVVLEMEPLNGDKLDLILRAYKEEFKISDTLRDNLVKFYTMALEAWKARTLSAPVSIRNIIHLAENYPVFGEKAMPFVVYAKFPTEEDKVKLSEMAQRAGLGT